MRRPGEVWRNGAAAAAAVAPAVVGVAVSAWADTGAAGQSVRPLHQRSGFDTLSPALQAMQRDDAQNPGLLWVDNGAALWRTAPGNGKPACAGCHVAGMNGVAARYPAFSAALKRPVTLVQQIDQCRSRHQGLPSLGPDHDTMLALGAYVGWQSRGQPIAPPKDSRLAAWERAGEALYRQRMGQLNLSCAQCHEERAGLQLAGAVIPSGLATGYPIYRLEWQGLGSLPRRLRSCTTGVRAAPLDETALTQLELYLARRAAGLPVETPGVRP